MGNIILSESEARRMDSLNKAASSNDDKYKTIAINALKCMSDTLAEMEETDAPPKYMMSKCVWPIILEASDRFSRLENGEDVKLDGFENVPLWKMT